MCWRRDNTVLHAAGYECFNGEWPTDKGFQEKEGYWATGIWKEMLQKDHANRMH